MKNNLLKTMLESANNQIKEQQVDVKEQNERHMEFLDKSIKRNVTNGNP